MAASQTVKIPQADHQKLSPRLEAGFRIARSGEDNPFPRQFWSALMAKPGPSCVQNIWRSGEAYHRGGAILWY